MPQKEILRDQLIKLSKIIIVILENDKIIKRKAEGFYSIHKDKPFFNDLIEYMTSGPVIVQVLQGDNAVESYRRIMGATIPIMPKCYKRVCSKYSRKLCSWFRLKENAKIEINYFFEDSEIFNN